MNEQNTYSEITPEILNLAKRCASIDRIDEELYRKYEVKRGLRDISGKGVLAGLTDISEIISYTIEDNDMMRGPSFLPRLQHSGSGWRPDPGQAVRL